MPRPKLNLTILDPASGRARPGAWVSIFAPGTITPVLLYADDDVSALPNPIQANGLGQVAMRVNPGLYDVSATWDGTQPTLIEDVLAWTPAEAILTTPGDILVMGDSGAQRLAVGANGQVLTVDAGMPAWKALGSGVGFPVGPSGSMLVYGPTGAIITLTPGVQDQSLVMAGGTPEWSSVLPPGTILPINTLGDLLVGDVSGLPARLAAGAVDSVLQVADTGALIWNPSGGGAITRGGGECRLVFVDTHTIRLQRHEGTQLWIDGRSRTIPDPGPTLASTGLALNTTYYIYAAMVGGVLTLEASATGSTTTTGLTHKTGDESRTLVGMVSLVNAGSPPDFADNVKQRLVRSHFNPTLAINTAHYTAQRAITSTVLVSPHDEIAVALLAVANTNYTISFTGMVNLTPNTGANIYVTIDTVGISGIHLEASATADFWRNATFIKAGTLAEGYHVVNIHAFVFGAAGTLSLHGEVDGITACRIQVLVNK